MKNYRGISRYISSIQRMSNPYFDKKLSKYNIGCGQQFFLLHIFVHPGISFQELAWIGNYDKGTATRAVRKLEREGYVRIETDNEDKRIRHLYSTDYAGPIIEATFETAEQWIDILTKGFKEEEKQQVELLLERMMVNARNYITGGEEE